MAQVAEDVSRGSLITLREVCAENVYSVLSLRVRDAQARFVASNAESIAEAHYHAEAWFRAIYANETAVGFLLLHDENLRPDPRQVDYYFLWRLMVDARYQDMGFGRRGVELLVDHVRSRPNAHTLFTSLHPGEGSPEGFYGRLGFRPTGRTIEGEIELALQL